jgi:TetR/AcrR family transcriptional regulator, transcriptional repressor for nem operon
MARARVYKMFRRAKAKAATHEKILATAGWLARTEGLAAASVPRVMRGAGLTVGGFYAHFPSKRAMDAEVIRRASAKSHRGWPGAVRDKENLKWLESAVKNYLSRSHRDDAASGCVFPAIVSELAHSGKGTREATIEAFENYARAIAAHAPETRGVTARERALATFVLCVGGIALARAFRGCDLSDEILGACRKWALPESYPPRRE